MYTQYLVVNYYDKDAHSEYFWMFTIPRIMTQWREERMVALEKSCKTG